MLVSLNAYLQSQHDHRQDEDSRKQQLGQGVHLQVQQANLQTHRQVITDLPTDTHTNHDRQPTDTQTSHNRQLTDKS